MKTPKIIITRDNDDSGMVSVFSGNGNPLKTSDGRYVAAIEIDCESFYADWFGRVFGFTPRRGSKAKYEIRLVKTERK